MKYKLNFFVAIQLGVFCLLALPSEAQLAAAEQSSEKMNVLFIISDDLRNEMGCYGSKLAKTPNLDRLAQRGIRFDRAYCQFPLCNPSRTSLLTGLRPKTTGVLGNRDWYGGDESGIVTLPRYFKQHGYKTLRAGKIFHSGLDDADAWSVGGEQRYYGDNAPARVPQRRSNASRTNEPRLTKAQRSDRWIVLEGERERSGDHRVANQTILMLREHASSEQPFFLACGLSKPHSPLAAPKRFFDMFDLASIPLPPDFASVPTVPEGFPAGSIRPRNADLFIGREASPEQAREMILAYLASSAWMDWNAGRVLDALEEFGLQQNTIVVFWGDHGYQLGEKGKWSKAGSLWEQGARVPLIVYDPRSESMGQTCPRVVETLDLYPTLAELCGLPAPAGVEGRSLAPLIENPQLEWDHPAYTVWSEDGDHITGVVVRNQRWRYAEFYGRGAGAMLTDSINDPHELTNLVNDPEYADVVAKLAPLAQQHSAGHRPSD